MMRLFLVATLGLLVMAPPAVAQLANAYPGDAGICGDPAVVFCEMFEDSVPNVLTRWVGDGTTSNGTVTGTTGQSFGSTQMALSATVPAGSSGTQSLRTRATGGSITTVQLSRSLESLCSPCTALYVRWYVNYSSVLPYHHTGLWVLGQNPKGAFLPAMNCNVTKSPPDPESCSYLLAGDTVFYIGMEGVPGSASPLPFDMYTGWMEMRQWSGGGDYPYIGNTFVPNTVTITPDAWHSIEVYIKMNTPVADRMGEMRLWIDGTEVINLMPGSPNGDWVENVFTPNPVSPNTFEGFRWRSTTALELAKVFLNHYSDALVPGAVQDVYWDHLVVATSRIGPMIAALPPRTVTIRFTDTQVDGLNQETGFIVNRKIPTGTWASIATPGPSLGSGGTVTVVDTTSPRPTACYQVAAVNGFGTSTYLGGTDGVCTTAP